MPKINSSKTPIYRESGFNLKDIITTKKAFNDELSHPHFPDNFIYSRYRNPTVSSVEEKIKEIEDSNWALLSQSGMSAIDIALSIFQEAKNDDKWLIFNDIYGGTNSYIDSILIKKRGLKIERFSSKDNKYNLSDYIELLDKIKPKLLYFETISNPMLIVADANKIIDEAKKRNVIVIVDNTFAGPYLWKPLKFGADIVIHSATKYLAGHGNITAGVICGNDDNIMQKAIEYRKLIGHMISPDDAYRLGTQLKTYNIRFKQQCNNANKLALFLSNNAKINKVYYPGLKVHKTYDNAKCLFGEKAYGAMITFELSGENDEEKSTKSQKFIELISKHFFLIPTLGDVDTIFLPVDAVWPDKYPTPGTFRLSVGIEDYYFIEKIFNDTLNSI
ncbi:MAG: aminotransferase class I/II-fold pyridoxal phosphate-dependent enzyme [Bacteroidales bacterium]|nr:aminotransferase class I/II-fold pyridoxal phosphate-dependent enzyme [Bacteroidales bacterium]MBN2758035.1 aminotransferase class I/II-fold pyridoxal phosphate-dependent enzyme [Bacteroidales bacterium]